MIDGLLEQKILNNGDININISMKKLTLYSYIACKF